ncbi:hypothetical protein DPMN_128525 [Dreissena polymorpha]|uniref:Uncharacterized protein n=1 Tax=Dreissena polymorpha TaxID=45954 RepID=A0A9D4H434_DREPO|nr:hypothetical protein DPMN_128525 [Dreissena polymorpha]
MEVTDKAVRKQCSIDKLERVDVTNCGLATRGTSENMFVEEDLCVVIPPLQLTITQAQTLPQN